MTTSYPILFQSVVSPTTKGPAQQLSNLQLTGLTTIDPLLNSDNGKLYGAFTYSGSTYALHLYKDAGKQQSVAVASSNALGLQPITSLNNSGLTGSVNFVSYVADDSALEAIAFLSRDSDIPMDNLQGLADYDPSFGFADFHIQAFDHIKNILTGRFESILWNPDLIDTRQINDGTGGFDLSRMLSWQSPDLREASAQYAFYLITRKQVIAPDSIYMKRAECAYGRVTALLNSVEMQFDQTYTRVPSKTRSTNTFKIGRS